MPQATSPAILDPHPEGRREAMRPVTSHRLYTFLLRRVDGWLDSGYATNEQKRALAAWLLENVQDEGQ
jgi:hypothetical protein